LIVTKWKFIAVEMLLAGVSGSAEVPRCTPDHKEAGAEAPNIKLVDPPDRVDSSAPVALLEFLV